MCCPNEPTEPPDNNEGARRGKVESRIEPVRTMESGKRSSLYAKADHVETVDDNDTQTAPRDPVGTSDGVERRPNEPTEPPDEEEGARRGNGKMKVDRRVETVEEVKTEESSQVNQPGDRGGNEDEMRRDEGQTGRKDEDEDGQRDGRTSNTGSPTSGTSPKRPTYHVNPPRHRGRLKTTPTDVSQPECQPDAMETVQSYWGSVPEPPDPRTKGTKARMSIPTPSTPPTPPVSHKLPYRVITLA
ncbi:hypothetical protein BDN67DRAFT_1015148 [Paxillus ammoniavirescens]|nr:hypothetical protein BDN67DRAFT_1015148 [Paxillus ammoniavirescens]